MYFFICWVLILKIGKFKIISMNGLLRINYVEISACELEKFEMNLSYDE